MERRQKQDYVDGLLTGRYASARDRDGKEIQVWKPRTNNPHPTLHQLRRDKGHRFTDDQIATWEGLHQRLSDIDRSVFSKTDTEKLALRKARKDHNRMMRKAGLDPNKQLNLDAPLEA